MFKVIANMVDGSKICVYQGDTWTNTMQVWQYYKTTPHALVAFGFGIIDNIEVCDFIDGKVLLRGEAG